ncbi:hypothetical protein KDK77_04995 [bacterium]|nr:hypothetical protein [bacterium]MCP5463225.1 hypothetical protein [bacterium]
MDNSSNDKPLLWGFGFDGGSADKYITRGDNFYLAGGSQQTHESMISNVMRFNSVMARYGKKLEDLTPAEYYRIIDEIGANKKYWAFYNNFYTD